MNEIRLTHTHLVSHKILYKMFGTVWKIINVFKAARTVLSQKNIADEIRKELGQTLMVSDLSCATF